MYEKEIFLLDLCILAYQLHAQTLLCPLDPFVEQVITPGRAQGARNTRRHDFFAQIKNRHLQNAVMTVLHGPAEFGGTLPQGWTPNDTLDAVLSDYRKVNPWAPAWSFLKTGEYLVYDAPRNEITDRISEVFVASYKQTNGPMHTQQPDTDFLPLGHWPRTRPAMIQNQQHDLLYCFEGGTGALGNSGPSMSLMGFALARETQGNNYDVYIVFRGSRSGALRFHQALMNERGNPDWVTDTGTQGVTNPAISLGIVYKGFERGIHFALPCIIKCLTAIAARKNNHPPDNIFVAGHSLGGALACYFASAINAGNLYGPDGSQLPPPLNGWQWDDLELVTYGAPRLGNDVFRNAFNGAVDCQRIRLKNDPIPTLGIAASLPTSADVALSGVVAVVGAAALPFAALARRGRHVGADWPLPDGPSREKAHDPAYIRGALLTYYGTRPNALPLQAPSQTVVTGSKSTNGRNHPGPWSTFDTIDDAVACIEARNPAGFFAGYAEDLAQYLEALRTILPAREQAQLTQAVINNLRPNPAPATDAAARAQLDPIYQLLPVLNTTQAQGTLRNFIIAWLRLAAMGWRTALTWQTVKTWYP